MCVGALLRGHERDTCLAAVGFMPPCPNRWRLWALVDSTVCVRDLCSRRLVGKRAPAALSLEEDQIASAEEPLAPGEKENQAPPVVNSFSPKEENHTSSIVFICCFSLHLIVTMGIMIAVFDQLSFLIMRKGISSRTFAKFG